MKDVWSLRHSRVQGLGALALAGLMVVSLTGCSALTQSSSGSASTGSLTKSEVAPVAPSAARDAAAAGGAEQAAQPNGTDAATPGATDRLVISTAGMTIEVKDVEAAVASVRTVSSASGAEITNLSILSGDGSSPVPVDAQTGLSGTPGTAQITLRVPADKLAQTEAELAKLGKVLSQTSSESDVTQQHIDMAARLKNLQAEEARLREFLAKATKVSEMLEIERELSRVRGEIESMQAQLSYLERQAAMATLNLSLSAPGAVVRPNGTDWGFGTAVTEGFQAAAGVIRFIILIAIALSPLILIAVAIWLPLRARRRRRRAAQAAEPVFEPAAGDQDEHTPPAQGV